MTISPRVVRSGCGIVGTIHCDLSDRDMAASIETLAHRGPDGRGAWNSQDRSIRLGHRRLAVIGLGEASAQPMTRGPTTITCNGEIYNYFELRRQLEARGHVFSSDCDTEAILHAYAQWGLDCLKRLNGVFAFALYDERNARLLLARDGLGVKPLVYTKVGRGLAFASEAKALLRIPGVVRRPCFETIRGDLAHDLLACRRGTWFEGIRNLEPGHALIVDSRTGEQRLCAFWQLPDAAVPVRDEQSAIQMLRETFHSSVRLQLLSHVGVSVALSGGVDSAALAATILKESDEPLTAFTVQYEESSPGCPDREDLRHVRQMVDAFPRLKGHVVPVCVRAMMSRERLDTLLQAFDGSMPIDYRVLGTLELYSQIRERGVKVVLTGQGADELWMGYYGHPVHPFWQFSAEQLSAQYLAREFLLRRIPLGFEAWNPSFLSPESALESSRVNLEANYQAFRTEDPIQRLSWWVIRTHLRALLNVDDRLSMLNGVETRVPWLDTRMAELSFSVPGYLKIAGAEPAGKVKSLLRKAMRGVVPDSIIDRRKASFPEPPRAYGEALRELMRADAEAIRGSAFLREMFAGMFLQNFIDQAEVGARELFMVYALWRFGECNRL
jgi:asparagine synthase (glutamine-hydrolysing)